MKYLIVIVIIAIIVIGVNRFGNVKRTDKQVLSRKNIDTASLNDLPQTTVIAEGLDTPWAIVFLPDKSMLVTERSGRVRSIDSSGALNPFPIAQMSEVRAVGEGGLLGITVHPDFSINHYVYLYYTYTSNGDNTFNRVVRMTYKENKLTEEKIIVNAIPGAVNHNGGRIKFGPDKLLYVATGDAQNPSQAQDTATLGGKILRVTDEGKAPPGNPFNNFVFSYGHRNVQGLAWDAQNMLWATEHGRSGLSSGLDELNLIESGKNYGWPEIQGDETRSGMETPRKNSGAFTTWAPSGMAFFGKSLFFAGLKGQALYEATIENGQVTAVIEHLKNQYGRIREVVVGPDNMLYITTSNRDGRGKPSSSDDKLIRVNPAKL